MTEEKIKDDYIAKFLLEKQKELLNPSLDNIVQPVIEIENNITQVLTEEEQLRLAEVERVFDLCLGAKVDDETVSVIVLSSEDNSSKRHIKITIEGILTRYSENFTFERGEIFDTVILPYLTKKVTDTLEIEKTNIKYGPIDKEKIKYNMFSKDNVGNAFILISFNENTVNEIVNKIKGI